MTSQESNIAKPLRAPSEHHDGERVRTVTLHGDIEISYWTAPYADETADMRTYATDTATGNVIGVYPRWRTNSDWEVMMRDLRERHNPNTTTPDEK